MVLGSNKMEHKTQSIATYCPHLSRRPWVPPEDACPGDESVSAHRHPEAMLHSRVRSWHCTFHGFGQSEMARDHHHSGTQSCLAALKCPAPCLFMLPSNLTLCLFRPLAVNFSFRLCNLLCFPDHWGSWVSIFRPLRICGPELRGPSLGPQLHLFFISLTAIVSLFM